MSSLAAIPGATTLNTLVMGFGSQYLRTVHTAFDHHWCKNSGFIAESLRTVVTGSLCI